MNRQVFEDYYTSNPTVPATTFNTPTSASTNVPSKVPIKIPTHVLPPIVSPKAPHVSFTTVVMGNSGFYRRSFSFRRM